MGFRFLNPSQVPGCVVRPSRWLFPCPVYIPCLTSACLTYTLLTWLTFRHASAPASDCPYQRSQEDRTLLLNSHVTDEPTWCQFPYNWCLPISPAEWRLPSRPASCPLHMVGCHSRTLFQTCELPHPLMSLLWLWALSLVLKRSKYGACRHVGCNAGICRCFPQFHGYFPPDTYTVLLCRFTLLSDLLTTGFLGKSLGHL